jgi:hypothetical protein
MLVKLERVMPEGYFALKGNNIVLYRNNDIDKIIAWAELNLNLTQSDLDAMREDFNK